MILIMFLFLIIIRKVFVMSIPKIIHYCWVGNSEKPKSVLKCIESWKKFCPGYEIKEWNESNYDFSKNEYMRQAYEAKKWGFVPDYARLDIIYNYGGIYLDTDVEIIKSFDEMLNFDAFIGFENTGNDEYFLNCGQGFGAAPHNEIIKEARDIYDNISFKNDDGTLNLTPSPHYTTQTLVKNGLKRDNKDQVINNVKIFSSDVLCPKAFLTGKIKITKRTVSIHHFTASWLDDQIKKELDKQSKIKRVFGSKLGGKILYFESVFKKYSLLSLCKKNFFVLIEKVFYINKIIKIIVSKIGACNNKNFAFFNTAINSDNIGDQIIVENCQKQILSCDSSFIDVKNYPTHTYLSKTEEKELKRIGNKIFFGTNMLSGNILSYGLWKIGNNLTPYLGTVLMGVGYDSKSLKSDFSSRLFFRTILSKKYVHSVRDSFSEKKLKSMGIKNVLNTCCPTMWGLTPEHCKNIPQEKSDKVISTITDYLQDFENDKKMLDILTECYDTVYLWLQGDGDKEYLNKLGYSDKVIIIDNNLKAYDNVLENKNVDYVGTRLHAGIRALSYKRRSLIISIDNRAECIASDTGLPILKRKDICELKDIITGKIQTAIKLPVKNIETWKAQFNKEQ